MGVDSMEEPKLKPCVVCGSEPVGMIGCDFHYVTCSNSHCSMRPLSFNKNTWNSNYEHNPQAKENAQLKADKSELLKEQKRLQSMLYDALSCTGYFDAVSKGVYQIQPVRIYPQQEKGEINGN